MKTSPLGVAFIEHHEGVVLRAYRDVVGVWTIGAGLTAASGVVTPKAGMVITKEEASRLFAEALRAKYEPSVAVAMTRNAGAVAIAPKQHEFDAGVSFHWNTGAIRTASWVKDWAAGAAVSLVRAKLALWNKGDGKVLPGLVRRRDEEASILLLGLYPGVASAPAPAVTPAPSAPFAVWALPVNNSEKNAARDALNALGYKAGSEPAQVLQEAARTFQRDHALTVDGIIGRATLTTLQRRLNSNGSTVAPAAALAVGVPAGASGFMSQLTDLPIADGAGAALALLLAARAGWNYRDVIASNLSTTSPRLAAFLRSF